MAGLVPTIALSNKNLYPSTFGLTFPRHCEEPRSGDEAIPNGGSHRRCAPSHGIASSLSLLTRNHPHRPGFMQGGRPKAGRELAMGSVRPPRGIRR